MPDTHHIELKRAPIDWDLNQGVLQFFGIDSAIFWLDPSVLRMLAPLAEEVGRDLFRMNIAHSSAFGTDEDYHTMISVLSDNFEDGFSAWGEAVSAAGWGSFERPVIDREKRTGTVVVHNPWELRMQASLPPEQRWGCPFLQGKIIGIFRHALGVDCWADEAISFRSGVWRLELSVYAADKTIPHELKRLRQVAQEERERTLQAQVEAQTAALSAASVQLEKHAQELESRVEERTRELQAATALAEAGFRAKTDFLAMMSHEIRTPLNGVLGMAQLLTDTPLSLEQQTCVETIGRAGEALLALLNDILDFSRIEAGKLDLESRPLSLLACLEDIEAVVAPLAHSKGLALSICAAEDVPLWVKGDILRLRQALTNLANNAVKFTEQGEVRVRVVVAARQASEVRLRFTITDTGIGITPSQQSRLFQAFSQADTSTTRRFGGTGLGLAISRRLIQAMGGELGLTSEPGVGSTFWCEVPFLTAATPEHAPLLKGTSVAIIEPHRPSAEALCWKLRSHGAKCSVVADIPAANEALQGSMLRLLIASGESPAAVQSALEADPRLHVVLPITAGVRPDEPSSPRCHALWPPLQPAVLRKLLHPSPPPQRTRSLQGVRVLVAEDHTVNQLVINNMLVRMGVEVSVVPNGRVALEALEAGRFDVVLMDCHMPELDGYSATERIREREGTGPRIPIVALTAGALEGDVERCRAAGMDDYLSKPVRMIDLETMLRKWAGR